MNYLTPSQYKQTPRSFEQKAKGMPSNTLPGESMTIPEMLEKFTKNNSMKVRTQDPRWHPNPNLDQPDLEEVKNSDLVDKQEYMNALNEERAHLEQQLKDAKTKEEQEKAEKEYNEFLNHFKKATESQKRDPNTDQK